VKRIVALALALGLPALALGQQAAPQLQEDPRRARFRDVERGLFVGFEVGYLGLLETPTADREKFPLAGEEGGRASGFPAVGILLGVDLGKRLSAALFLQGANLETSTDYGAFDLFAAGGDLKLNLLGYDDRNGIERLYVYVHARGGVAKTSPEGLFGADEVIAAVGPGLEYYTQLRHFSIALGADAVYASEAGAFGFAVYPTLRYTF
jgi:hypothetical protein